MAKSVFFELKPQPTSGGFWPNTDFYGADLNNWLTLARVTMKRPGRPIGLQQVKARLHFYMETRSDWRNTSQAHMLQLRTRITITDRQGKDVAASTPELKQVKFGEGGAVLDQPFELDFRLSHPIPDAREVSVNVQWAREGNSHIKFVGSTAGKQCYVELILDHDETPDFEIDPPDSGRLLPQ